MRKIFLSACALSLLFVSCKKSDSVSVTPTKENMAGNYKYVSVTMKMGNMPETNYMDMYLDDCEKDDVMSLNANGTYAVTDAGVSCGTQPNSGYWNLANSTTFEMDGTPFTIAKFDGSTLQINQSDTSSGQTMTLSITVKKQ